MLVNVARRSRDDVEAAVRRLLELALVELAWAEGGWPRVDEAERAELSCFANWMRWEPNGGYWALAEGARSVALVRAGGEAQREGTNSTSTSRPEGPSTNSSLRPRPSRRST